MRYMVCYDVTDDHRRNRIADTLKDYGSRIQFSVFLADLDDALTGRMINALKREINADQDKVHIFPLCRSCSAKALMLGLAETPKDEPFYII
jgi:CRISPR-associated protein Cas2